MKQLSLLLAFILVLSGTVRAQDSPAPIIKDLRTLVESGRTNFRNEVGALLEVDTPDHIAVYKTVKESAGAITAIMQPLDGGRRVYMIRYELKDISTDMLLMMNRFVNLYIDELNTMVKSGKYTGSDGTDTNGTAVTEINDAAGNHVLDYKSNKDMQAIYLYGLNYSTK